MNDGRKASIFTKWTTPGHEKQTFTRGNNRVYRVLGPDGLYHAPNCKVHHGEGVHYTIGRKNIAHRRTERAESPDIQRSETVSFPDVESVFDFTGKHRNDPSVALTHGIVKDEYADVEFKRRGVDLRGANDPKKRIFWKGEWRLPFDAAEVAEMGLEDRACHDATQLRDFAVDILFIDYENGVFPEGQGWFDRPLAEWAEYGRGDLCRFLPMLDGLRGMWTTTGSSGRKGSLRFRFAFPLNRFATGLELTAMAETTEIGRHPGNNQAILLADRAIYRPQQPIYVAEGQYPGTEEPPDFGSQETMGWLKGEDRKANFSVVEKARSYKAKRRRAPSPLPPVEDVPPSPKTTKEGAALVARTRSILKEHAARGRGAGDGTNDAIGTLGREIGKAVVRMKVSDDDAEGLEDDADEATGGGAAWFRKSVNFGKRVETKRMEAEGRSAARRPARRRLEVAPPGYKWPERIEDFDPATELFLFPEPVSMEDPRGTCEAKTAEFYERVIAGEAPRWVFKAETGSGKTAAVVGAGGRQGIAHVAAGVGTGYFVPNHGKRREIAAQFRRAMDGDSPLLMEFMGRGVEDSSGETMCEFNEIIDEVAKEGDGEEGVFSVCRKCPKFNMGCAYIEHLRINGRIHDEALESGRGAFAAAVHDHMSSGMWMLKSGEEGGEELVRFSPLVEILDEEPKSRVSFVEVPVEHAVLAFRDLRGNPSFNGMEVRKRWDDREEEWVPILSEGEAEGLRDMVAVPLLDDLHEWAVKRDWKEMHGLFPDPEEAERRFKGTLRLLDNLTVANRRKLAQNAFAEGGTGRGYAERVWKEWNDSMDFFRRYDLQAIKSFLRAVRDDLLRRREDGTRAFAGPNMTWIGSRREKVGDRVQEVLMFQAARWRRTPFSKDSACLYLDATTSEGRARRRVGEEFEFFEFAGGVNIDLHGHHGVEFGKQSITGYGDDPESKKNVAARRRREWIADFIARHGIQGGIMQQAVERAMGLEDDPRFGHQNNIRGIDHYEGLDPFLSLGQVTPRVEDVEAEARALVSAFPNEFDPDYRESEHCFVGVRVRGEADPQPFKTRRHPGTAMQEAADAITENESMQSIGRVRGYKADPAKTVFILSGVPVPMEYATLKLLKDTHNPAWGPVETGFEIGCHCLNPCIANVATEFWEGRSEDAAGAILRTQGLVPGMDLITRPLEFWQAAKEGRLLEWSVGVSGTRGAKTFLTSKAETEEEALAAVEAYLAGQARVESMELVAAVAAGEIEERSEREHVPIHQDDPSRAGMRRSEDGISKDQAAKLRKLGKHL